MNCPNCGITNPANAAFCSECGAPLPTPPGGASQQQSPSALESAQRGQQAATDALAPSSLGQLLSHTLGVYLSLFGPIVRIALFAQIPLLAATFVSGESVRLVLTLVWLFFSPIAGAAVAYSVARLYVGQRTGAMQSFVGAMNNGTSLLLNNLAYMGALFAALLLSALLVGLPILVFVMVAWSCYIQAVVIEGGGPMAALMRSWQLVRGSWWRIFGILLVFSLLAVAVALLASLPGLGLALVSTRWGDFLATLGQTLATPILYIALTLVYLDLRARKEGLSLERLAQEVASAPRNPSTEGPRRPL
ncbi:MAG: zinc ribbon domain-containing protein [Chloroflexi bacterium]|nr:zinc ribbon domain-containing protein [Chloroflexota bacterium]